MPRYRAKDLDKRSGQTLGLSGFLATERSRILDGASTERRAQMRAAEHTREVYAAWNAVVGGTREGKHVTGLRYLPESNELLVYLDAAPWTQEMTMLREIIRGRMEREGVSLDGFLFKTTRRPVERASSTPGPRMPAGAVTTKPPAAVHRDLTPAERERIDRQTAAIEDPKLRQALRNAMEASVEYRPADEG